MWMGDFAQGRQDSTLAEFAQKRLASVVPQRCVGNGLQ